MRLLAIHSIYSEAGNHPPGSELVLQDKEEAARLIEIGAAIALDDVSEPEPPTQKTKKGPNAKT